MIRSGSGSAKPPGVPPRRDLGPPEPPSPAPEALPKKGPPPVGVGTRALLNGARDLEACDGATSGRRRRGYSFGLAAPGTRLAGFIALESCS
jgi:hypothetical protein